jgi:beta-lactam-binding protein with PASTA domain
VDSVSCGAAGDCAAGGTYIDGSGSDSRAFVVSETSGSWGNAIDVHFSGSCVVPHVVGKALRTAKKKLKASHCGLGKIKMVHSKAKKGRVVAQRPKPGKHLKIGGKVALTVSKGKKT